LKSGRQLQARPDARTDSEQLSLRFGTDRTKVVRQIRWEDVESVARRGQKLSFEEVRGLSREPPDEGERSFASPGAASAGRVAEIIPHEYVQTDFRPALPRVQSVQFDAFLSNWDAGVETDGLVVQVWPLDGYGNYVPVRGVLQAELWAMRRTRQSAAPSSGGRLVEQVANSSIPFCATSSADPPWLQLPFQARHPEFDNNWSPFGLLQFSLVVPGHGVFHDTQDGLRIRPFAPLRDFLERENRTRFLPSESTDRKQ
jgi:hypothetical protein